jgi:hypothetical protein
MQQQQAAAVLEGQGACADRVRWLALSPSLKTCIQ